MLNCSESCRSDASDCPCPCLFVLAGVAVFSTPLATTEWRAADQGLGRRGFAVESVVAQICREGGARVSPNLMLRDSDISPSENFDDAWGGSLHSTRLFSLHSMETVRTGEGPTFRMERFWVKPGRTR